MRGFFATLFIMVAVVAVFFFGLFNTSSVLMLSGFCAAPFVMFALGWTARGALKGRRIALISTEQERRPVAAPLPQQSRLHRAQQRAAASSTTEHQF